MGPYVFKPLSILPLESTPLEIAYVVNGNCWHGHLKIIKNNLIQPRHYSYYFFSFLSPLFLFLPNFFFFFFLIFILLITKPRFLPTYWTSQTQIPQFLANQTRSQQNIWKPNTTQRSNQKSKPLIFPHLIRNQTKIKPICLLRRKYFRNPILSFQNQTGELPLRNS